ncbi:MAG: hypothetical protein HY443_01765 [Candidatus Nealsonbacteria bacterium]|nr:hypothetical protein [Candidatus Nealsonbacteria bacterium]
MDNKKRDELWGVAGRYLGEEPMHGLPHIRRVHANFEMFQPEKPWGITYPVPIRDALETAVILHDIGRSVAGQADHAPKSAELLKNMFQGELADVPNQEWVLKAVGGHSVGLEGQILDQGDEILALLCVFDHMDCLGVIGIHRLTIYWCGGQPYRIPWVPAGVETKEQKERMLKEIEYLLAHPEKIARRDIGMRERSFLDCLVYYFCATSHIIEPVSHLLGQEFYDENNARLAYAKRYILHLAMALLFQQGKYKGAVP